MTIDDTNVAASRGEVRMDTDGTLWTRATAAWRQYPQTQSYAILTPQSGYTFSANLPVVRGQVYLVPIPIPQKLTIQKTFFAVNSGVGVGRFVLYADNGNTPVGGNKVWDSGNIGMTSVRNAATAAYVSNPGLIWLGVTFSTNAIQIKTLGGTYWTDFGSATFSYRAGTLASGTNTESVPTETRRLSVS